MFEGCPAKLHSYTSRKATLVSRVKRGRTKKSRRKDLQLAFGVANLGDLQVLRGFG